MMSAALDGSQNTGPAALWAFGLCGEPESREQLDSLGKAKQDYPPKTLDCLGIIVGLFR